MASVTDTVPYAPFEMTSAYVNVVDPDGTEKPSTRLIQMPAAGLLTVTDSSESPSAFCAARTQPPLVQL